MITAVGNEGLVTRSLLWAGCRTGWGTWVP